MNKTALQMNSTEQIAQLVRSLKLHVVQENWLLGEHEGVPIALHVIATGEVASLLFHVRYPTRQFESETPAVEPDSALGKMVESGQADVTIHSSTSWLTISLVESVTSHLVHQILSEFINCLKNAGVDLRRRLCVNCGDRPVEVPRFENELLNLTCESCHTEGEADFKKSSELYLPNVPLIILRATLCSILGATIWTGMWYVYDSVLEFVGTISLPILFIVLLRGGWLPGGKTVHAGNWGNSKQGRSFRSHPRPVLLRHGDYGW